MSLTQAKYYPEIMIESKETPFGAIETNYPNLYTKPIKNNTSVITCVEFDALEALHKMWGSSILNLDGREVIYKLVSGNLTSSEFTDILRSLYLKFDAFANYMDNEIYFGNKDIPLAYRIIKPVRKAINSYIDEITAYVESKGGNVRMISHDKIYATFRYTPTDIPYSKVKVYSDV